MTVDDLSRRQFSSSERIPEMLCIFIELHYVYMKNASDILRDYKQGSETHVGLPRCAPAVCRRFKDK